MLRGSAGGRVQQDMFVKQTLASAAAHAVQTKLLKWCAVPCYAGRRYDWMKEGRDVVRIFDKNSLSWQALPGVKLSEYRWYPTQVLPRML